MNFLFRLFYRSRLPKVWGDQHLRRIASAGGIVLACVLLNALCFRYFEGPRLAAEGKQLSLEDSVWLSLTTITTVGYGDLYAATRFGRLATVLLLYLVGLACFPYAVGQALEYLVEGSERRRRGMEDLRHAVRGHIIIANFPSAQKVRRIISQLQADHLTAAWPIVIVAGEIAELPFEVDRVHFVAGSPEEVPPLERANVMEARAAIVLRPSTDARAADALTAAAVSVIEGLNSRVNVVAELGSLERHDLFRFCNCDSIVPTEDIGAMLLAQEVRDPGVAPFVAELLTQGGDTAAHSVAAGLPGWSFGELQVRLVELRSRAIPLGLLRDGRKLVNPDPDTLLQEGDRLILVGSEQIDWPAIRARLLAKQSRPAVTAGGK